MSSRKLYRQGDVLLVSTSVVPEGAMEKDRILAKGEFTGHYHAVTTPAIVSIVNGTSMQYVDSAVPFTLEHQEHANITVPAGTYEVRIQRELDLLGSIRQVMD